MYNKTVAEEILKQLGGNKFKAMTGANSFLWSSESKEPFLSFRLPGNGFAKNGVNYVKVTLDRNDTYTIEFAKLGRVKGIPGVLKPIKTVEGVYNSMLQKVFTSVTGLDTHL